MEKVSCLLQREGEEEHYWSVAARGRENKCCAAEEKK
jgi:hypothetical protein